jgi:signal transduction histidine kinase
MTAIRAGSVTQRSILRVLTAGFGLVILLLVAGSIAGFRNTRLIQQGVADLVKEQVVIGRLITEMQAQQATLNEAFHELALDGETMDRDALLRQLEDTRQAIARILSAASGAPEEGLWKRLNQIAGEFSEESAQLMSPGGAPSAEKIESLIEKHEEAIPLVGKLIAASTDHAASLQQQMERQSQRLMAGSFFLVAPGLILALLCAVWTVGVAGRLFRRMEAQGRELNRVTWHMLEGQEVLVRRFSHELHDELGQSLAALKAGLSGMGPENVSARRTDCIHLVDEAISNVREVSQLMRPVILDDFGLDAALRWLTDKFTQRTRIDVKYTSGFSGRLSEETETHLFRIAQEALTNIARHSGATAVSVALERRSGDVRLSIADNGRGLEQGPNGNPGLGMVGMRARAEYAGGRFRVGSGKAGGVTIDVNVPAREAVEHAGEKNPHFVG